MAYKPLWVIKCQSHLCRTALIQFKPRGVVIRGINTFPKGIYVKVNVIAWVEFELTYFEATVHSFSHRRFAEYVTLLLLFHLACPVDWDSLVRRLHHCRGLRSPHNECPRYDTTTWWWGSSNTGALGNAEYIYIYIYIHIYIYYKKKVHGSSKMNWPTG